MNKVPFILAISSIVLALSIFTTPITVYASTGGTESDVSIFQKSDTSDSEETEYTESDPDTMFPSNRNHLNEKAIQAVDSGMTVNANTVAQPYNIVDILSRIALVFTIIAIAVFWIINTVKEKKDPLRRYLK